MPAFTVMILIGRSSNYKTYISVPECETGRISGSRYVCFDPRTIRGRDHILGKCQEISGRFTVLSTIIRSRDRPALHLHVRVQLMWPAYTAKQRTVVAPLLF